MPIVFLVFMHGARRLSSAVQLCSRTECSAVPGFAEIRIEFVQSRHVSDSSFKMPFISPSSMPNDLLPTAHSAHPGFCLPDWSCSGMQCHARPWENLAGLLVQKTGTTSTHQDQVPRPQSYGLSRTRLRAFHPSYNASPAWPPIFVSAPAACFSAGHRAWPRAGMHPRAYSAYVGMQKMSFLGA